MRKLIALLSCSVLALSCAAEEKNRVDWGEEAVVTERGGVASLTTQPDFDQHAASFHSATVCEEAARNEISGQPKRAAMLMRGCMRREDFTSLLYFTNPPWKQMKFNNNDLDLLLHVAVRTGSVDVSKDFKQLGFEVTPYEAFRDGEKADGGLVTARVLLLDQRQDNRGYLSTVRLYGLRSSAKTYTWKSSFDDESTVREFSYGRAAARNAVPLGLTLQIRTDKPLPKDQRVLVLGRFVRGPSLEMQRKAQAKIEALSEEPEENRKDFKDPPAEAIIEVIATET